METKLMLQMYEMIAVRYGLEFLDPFEENVSYGALKATLCRAIERNESQNGDERRAFPLDTICDLHKRKALRKEVKVSIDELEQKITRSSQEDNFQGSNLIYRKFKDNYDVAQIFFFWRINWIHKSITYCYRERFSSL